MSIYKSLNIGVSGLNASGFAMNIIGDNIANSQTIGFKGARAHFSDVFADTMLGGGSGVRIGGISRDQTQGDLEVTGNALDMGISGPGFFPVRGPQGTFYTRAGQFGVDAEGFISSPSGMRLQGYTANKDGVVSGSLGDIQLIGLTTPPRATSEANIEINLDSSAEPRTDVFDPAHPSDTSDFSSSVTLYDGLGNPITADIYYRKVGTNQWEYKILVNGSDLEGGIPDEPTEIGGGQLDFDESGQLSLHSPDPGSFTPAGASAEQPVELSFENSTQYASESTLRFLDQDGNPSGDLADIEVNDKGEIFGVFTNGERELLAQVAVARFQAPDGLHRRGDGLWEATPYSGEPLLGEGGTGGRGVVVGGTLEASNVEMTHEFVKMIAVQRTFQANARTVTTADAMLTEAMNIKR